VSTQVVALKAQSGLLNGSGNFAYFHERTIDARGDVLDLYLLAGGYADKGTPLMGLVRERRVRL